MRISRILQAYPEQQFILLGDDSQQDPFIYASVTEQFSLQIRAVYLRNVFYKNTNAVNAAIARIRQAGVPVCHFQHSKEALEHSSSAGLI